MKIVDYHAGLRTALTAGLAAGCYALAFVNSASAWAAFFFMLPLCFGLQKNRVSERLLRGFVFGFLCTIGVCLWVFNTLNVAGGASSLAALGGLFFLACYVGLFYAVFLSLLQLGINAIRSSSGVACFSASLWVCVEYLRAIIPPGTTWAMIGLTQVDVKHLTQIADITGVYGVSWLVVFVGTLISLFCCRFSDYSKKDVSYASAVVIILTASVVVYSEYRLDHYTNAKHVNTNEAVTVAVFQGSIPVKGLGKRKNLNPYTKLLSEASKTQGVELFIWPETILGSVYDENTPPLLQALLRQTSSTLLVGGYQKSNITGNKFNTALLFDEDRLLANYQKIKLMPLVEYAPAEWMRRISSSSIQDSESLTPGYATETMPLKGSSMGVFICFDAMFPDLVSGFVLSGAGFLVSIAEESWLGSPFASKQYLDITRFRAIENRRYLARSSNQGYSAVITPAGQIASVLDRGTKSYSIQTIHTLSDLTIYTRYGDVFARLCFVIAFLGLAYVYWVRGASIRS